MATIYYPSLEEWLQPYRECGPFDLDGGRWFSVNHYTGSDLVLSRGKDQFQRANERVRVVKLLRHPEMYAAFMANTSGNDKHGPWEDIRAAFKFMESLHNMPVIRLGNGVRVGNFCSAHPFVFDTGEVLPSCSETRATDLMLDSSEQLLPRIDGTSDITLTRSLPLRVLAALEKENHSKEVDVILCPLPVMECLRQEWGIPVLTTKFRGIRTADRITKTICSGKWVVG